MQAMRPTVVALNGVRGFSPPSETEAAEFRNSFCAKHLGARPHILFMSDGVGHKNGALLRHALNLWPNRSTCSLLVIAPEHRAQAWHPAPQGIPFCTTDLSDEDLRLAYGTAYCLVFPRGFRIAHPRSDGVRLSGYLRPDGKPDRSRGQSGHSPQPL